MTNLTQTAYWTRRLLKAGAILIALIIVLRIGFTIFSNVWRKINPPPPVAPTVSFGKLPKINFPQNNEQSKDINYKLETIQGGLPKFSAEPTNVYFTQQNGSNLLALDRANQKALKLGFKNQPQSISEKVYRWQTEAVPTTILDMDITTGNFKLAYDYNNDAEVINSNDLPSNQQAAQEAKSFLNNNDLLPEDLATGTAEFNYLKFSPPDLTPVASLSEADFIRVNLFRSNLNDLKILPPNPKNALVSILFSGIKTIGKRIIEVNYIYYPIYTETVATYPLKNVQTAWQELQNNESYIANLGQNKETITIRQVYLAYYDSERPQHYLQPVYVFEGDNNFVAYVQAVDSKWTE